MKRFRNNDGIPFAKLQPGSLKKIKTLTVLKGQLENTPIATAKELKEKLMTLLIDTSVTRQQVGVRTRLK